MMMATRSSLPPSLYAISGLIPLTETLFLWPSLVMTAALVVVSVLLAWASAPPPEKARTAESFGVDLGEEAAAEAAEAAARKGST